MIAVCCYVALPTWVLSCTGRYLVFWLISMLPKAAWVILTKEMHEVLTCLSWDSLCKVSKVVFVSISGPHYLQ